MPGFKPNRIRFRPSERSDAAHIGKWLAGTLRQSPEWERQFVKLLLEEWAQTAKLLRDTSWMAMYGKQRLFFLEIAAEDQVFLTAPGGLLDNPVIALAAWRRAVLHLRNLGTLPGIRVTIDRSREVECECLLELGFIELPPNGNPNQRVFALNFRTFANS